MRLTALLILVSWIALVAVGADDEYVKFAKSLSARDYEQGLPYMPIDPWLKSILPKEIVAVWGKHVTDCGEQTGDPAVDRQRDMPFCAEVTLKQNDHTVGYLLLFVGTQKKGKMKDSSRLYFGNIKQAGKTLMLRKLSDLTRIK